MPCQTEKEEAETIENAEVEHLADEIQDNSMKHRAGYETNSWMNLIDYFNTDYIYGTPAGKGTIMSQLRIWPFPFYHNSHLR